MKKYWENDGQPNEQGEYVACLDLENGSGVQRFIGKDGREVADKLLDAQLNASAKIAELSRSERNPDPPRPAAASPKVLSADERFQLTEDLKDASKAPEAISRAVEAVAGVSLSEVRDRTQKEREEELAREAERQAIAFKDDPENSDFYPCAHNFNVMSRYMMLNDMPPTKKNFEIAFGKLKAEGLMTPAPAANPDIPTEGPEDPPQPEPAEKRIASTTRPRGVVSSTGIRSGDSSAGAPAARTAAQPKYTKAEILNMPSKTYDYKLANEAGFAETVDSLFEPKKKATR